MRNRYKWRFYERWVNLRPVGGTPLLKSLWCRWLHQGDRTPTGFPGAGKMLIHDITCLKCGARYEVQRPNTPQYGLVGPWGKPDLSQPDSWFTKEGKLRTQ